MDCLASALELECLLSRERPKLALVTARELKKLFYMFTENEQNER